MGLQVTLSLQALEAIGAVGIVRALRSSHGEPSFITQAQEMARSGNYDTGELPEIHKGLRENIAIGMSHVLGDIPEGLQAAIPPPRPPEGVETREVLRRLIDAYVAAHQEDLGRDVARYGDSRRHPDFDPQRAGKSRARRINHLNDQGYQRNAIDGLRERLDKLKALAENESPESPRLNKACTERPGGIRGLWQASPRRPHARGRGVASRGRTVPRRPSRRTRRRRRARTRASTPSSPRSVRTKCPTTARPPPSGGESRPG